MRLLYSHYPMADPCQERKNIFSSNSWAPSCCTNSRTPLGNALTLVVAEILGQVYPPARYLAVVKQGTGTDVMEKQ